MLLPLKNKSARFYASAAGKITIIFLAIVFALLTVNNLYALSVSCNMVMTGSCNGTIVALTENETHGGDNAHAQILDNNITLYMPFDINYSTNTGAVRDFSKYQNNGTLAGNSFWESTGRYGNSYRFDGTGDWIAIPVSASTNISTENFTVCAWFNTTGTEEDIVGTGSTGSGDYLLMSYLTKLRGHLWTSAGSNTIDSNAIVNTGAWVHGCQVVNSTSITLYVNGTLDATQLLSGNRLFDTSPTIIIGSRAESSAGYNFLGEIDDVIVWNRSLSSGEISELYNYGYVYNYSICCTSPDSTLSGACTQSIPLKLSNYTNAHVQTSSYTGPGITYPVLACLSANPGRVECVYQDSACTGTYTCLGSIASSEIGDGNTTNAHIGSCSEYKKRICCKMNSPPGVSNMTLNSTYGTNLTTENLTVYFNMSDADGDAFTNITDWRVNGTSIALLNMAFNTNTSSTAAGAVRDYSTHSNNGTLGGGSASAAPKWNITGKIGGAYTFDKVNDYINAGTVRANVSNNFTVSVWVNPAETSSSWKTIIAEGCSGFDLAINGGTVQFGRNCGQGYNFFSGGSVSANNWVHLALVFNGTNLTLYKDGVYTAMGAGLFSGTSQIMYVGSYNGNDELFNGSIDEIQIFNRSLSSYQIAEMYRAGVNNLSVQRIHDNETEKGQNWTVAVTGNDLSDGETVLSNQVIIRNTPPTVTLTAPDDGNATTNRTPMFNWSGFDPDGDSMTYEINFTTFLDAGATSLCADVRSATTANTYYIPTGDLLCLKDNGVYYRWSVRANDGGGYGAWSSVRVINITALTTISLPVNTMEFGSMRINDQNDSTDDAPAPFVLQNDGNSLLHINMSATNLWQSIANPSKYYKFKVDNVTGETNAFNWSGSTTGFTNTTSTETLAFHRINYSNIKDSGEIDIFVQVPPNEPPAIRNSTAVFYSYLAET